MKRPKETYQDTDGLYYEGEDGWGGVCPLCGNKNNDERGSSLYHIGRDHWFACFPCKVRWCIGSNLFSMWRYMDDKDFEANYELLKDLQNADEIYEASPLYEEKERQFREQCEADKKSYEREKETGEIEDDYDSLIN